MLGKTADARRIIAELEEQLKRGAASPDYIAGIYARLGEKEKALAWLERAFGFETVVKATIEEMEAAILGMKVWTASGF